MALLGEVKKRYDGGKEDKSQPFHRSTVESSTLSSSLLEPPLSCDELNTINCKKYRKQSLLWSR